MKLLDNRDILDLKNAVSEIYSEFYSHEVYYLPLLDQTSDSIYDEKKKGKRNYGTPIQLIARVDLDPKKEEDRADIGGSSLVVAKFEIPILEMENNGLGDKTSRELRRGIIRYKNVDYNISRVRGVTSVSEVNLLYSFESSGEID